MTAANRPIIVNCISRVTVRATKAPNCPACSAPNPKVSGRPKITALITSAIMPNTSQVASAARTRPSTTATLPSTRLTRLLRALVSLQVSQR